MAIDDQSGDRSEHAGAPRRGAKGRSARAPNYPELAKKMHIHGMVKIEATVRANGSVKSTRVWAEIRCWCDAAVDAVSKWKFESAQNETTEVVQLNFDDQ